MRDNPIGVFDSGIGGLTVTKEIVKRLPNESLIYLGDTARVPYGTRSKETITKFAIKLVEFLLKQDVKILVAACNTISSTCLDIIEQISSVPVIGVIKPAVIEAVKSTKTNRIGIIGTRATIMSKFYESEIKKLNSEIEVFNQACPLFVPLAEEGMVNHEATKLIAKEYLTKLSDSKIDTLILGCTHYPILKNIIQEVIGSDVKLIDSAKPTTEILSSFLKENNLLSNGTEVKYEFYVTDDPERVSKTASIFFNKGLSDKLKKVKIESKP
ncbi:MAG: glutamate racemase [bacterium]